MSQCRFRASDATATLRSRVLGYMGSTEAIKSLVEPVIRFVQRRFERMVLEQGGGARGCLPYRRASLALYVPARPPRNRARHRLRNATPCPPPSSMALGDSPQFFPAFSRHNFCLFFPTNLHQPKGAFACHMN